MSMLPSLLISLFVLGSSTAPKSSICTNTESCINRVKEVVAEPKRFWFGEQRRAQCHHRNSNPVDCHGPAHLSNFHSIGSRLFRVPTFHSAYLRNLEIFPRITYRPVPGSYRACEHDFHITSLPEYIEAHVDMTPVTPFAIRNRPEISWSTLQYDDEYIVLMTDVGLGTLNYLAVDFPRDQKILRDYEPSDNFRSMSNPLILLIFRKGQGNLTIPSGDDFDLVRFMTDNGLEDNLVGMNVVVVSSDPFAIERQRLKGTADNCHGLLLQKLYQNPPAGAPVLKELISSPLAQWLSIAYQRPELEATVCCNRVSQRESRVFIDPLGEEKISALSTVEVPSFTSLRMAQPSMMSYHRQARTYLALMDDLYSLVLIDGVDGHLHWLLSDIPSSELATDRPKGNTRAEYLTPAPADPATCKIYIFALLQQSGSLSKSVEFCRKNCIERKEFRLTSFAQQHGLRIVALNWMNSCFDLPYAYHVLSIANATRSIVAGERSSFARATVDAAYRTCAAFDAAPHRRCALAALSSTSSPTVSLAIPALFILSLLTC